MSHMKARGGAVFEKGGKTDFFKAFVPLFIITEFTAGKVTFLI